MYKKKIISKYIQFIGKIYSSNSFLRIITYHSISDNFRNKYNVSIKNFEEQIKYLKQSNFISLRAKDILDVKSIIGEKSKYVVVSFDDGVQNNLSNAVNILKKYDFTATFFVFTAGITSDRNKYNSRVGSFSNVELMSWDDLGYLDNMAFEIGSHSHTHTLISKLDKKQAETEISVSKSILEDKLNKNVVSFSYPFGHPNSYSKYTKEMIKEAGYKIACTQDGGIIRKVKDCFQLPRIGITGDDNLESFKLKVCGYYDCIKILNYRYYLK